MARQEEHSRGETMRALWTIVTMSAPATGRPQSCKCVHKRLPTIPTMVVALAGAGCVAGEPIVGDPPGTIGSAVLQVNAAPHAHTAVMSARRIP